MLHPPTTSRQHPHALVRNTPDESSQLLQLLLLLLLSCMPSPGSSPIRSRARCAACSRSDGIATGSMRCAALAARERWAGLHVLTGSPRHLGGHQGRLTLHGKAPVRDANAMSWVARDRRLLRVQYARMQGVPLWAVRVRRKHLARAAER